MDKIFTMTVEEWTAKGTQLFGPNMKDWKWVCPSCRGIQGHPDFKNLGLDDNTIRGIVYFSCVGRYDGHMSNDAFVSGQSPCNYTTGGLINISPIRVIDQEGNEHSAFAFYEPKEGDPDA